MSQSLDTPKQQTQAGEYKSTSTSEVISTESNKAAPGIPKPKVGLVLPGGGAKGAYQIGAWKAFAKANVEFNAFAGTSIGSFNMALMQAKSQEESEKLWMRLSTLRRAKLSRFFLLTILLAVLSAFRNPSYDKLSKQSRQEQAAFGALLIILVLASFYFGGIFKPSYKGNPVGTALTVVILFGIYLAASLRKKLNLGLLSHSSLKALLDQSIDIKSLVSSATPLFVTAAREVHRSTASLSKPSTLMVPMYIPLNSLTPDQAQKTLLASMAIPFGVFGAVKLDSGFYVDGGVADNIPFYPLVLAGCKKIYIVHLSPRPKQSGLLITKSDELHLRMLWIDDLIKEAGGEAVYSKKETERALEFIEIAKTNFFDKQFAMKYLQKINTTVPAEIIHIVPRKRLAIPLLGTIWFSPSKTQKLIDLGFRDTWAALSGEGGPPEIAEKEAAATAP